MLDAIRKDLECRRAFAANRARVREIESSLGLALEGPVRLVPRSLTGRDDVLDARRAGRTLALVRVFNPHKHEPWRDSLPPNLPVRCLEGLERIDREWSAYERLAPTGLAPKPLWRDHDATACERVPLPRASNLLARRPSRVWDALDAIFRGLSAMHALGEIHLDLGVSNVLLAPDASRVAFIDFEYAPAPASGVEIDPPTQRAYDYLRLINSCLKRRRGGHHLAKEYPRLGAMLASSIDERASRADVAPLLIVIPKIARNPALRAALARAVPSLCASDRAFPG